RAIAAPSKFLAPDKIGRQLVPTLSEPMAPYRDRETRSRRNIPQKHPTKALARSSPRDSPAGPAPARRSFLQLVNPSPRPFTRRFLPTCRVNRRARSAFPSGTLTIAVLSGDRHP